MMPKSAGVSACLKKDLNLPWANMKFRRKLVAPATISTTVVSSTARLSYEARLSYLTAKPPVDTAETAMFIASKAGIPSIT